MTNGQWPAVKARPSLGMGYPIKLLLLSFRSRIIKMLSHSHQFRTPLSYYRMLSLITGLLGSIVFLHATDLETEKSLHDNFWDNVIKDYEIETKTQANWHCRDLDEKSQFYIRQSQEYHLQQSNSFSSAARNKMVIPRVW